MNKHALLIICVFISVFVSGQSLSFFHLGNNAAVNPDNDFGSIDLSDNCTETWNNLLDNQTHDLLNNLTFLPNGDALSIEFYNGFSAGLLKIDFAGQKIDTLRIIPDLVLPTAVVAASNNELYIGDGTLKKYNLSTLELTDLGMPGLNNVPAKWIQSLTMHEGDIYASISHPVSFNQIIIRVDLNNLLNSEQIIQVARPLLSVTHMTTINFKCDSSKIILVQSPSRGANFFELDIEAPAIIPICNKPDLFIRAIAHPSESIQYDCIPILDLDSITQPATYLDYYSDTLCIAETSEIFPLKPASPLILTNTQVDSIQVSISQGAKNHPDEWIGCTNAAISCSNSGSGIVFKNSAGESNDLFLNKIKQSLFYKNTAAQATPGMRKIAFVSFHGTYQSDTSFLWLPIFPEPDAGLNGDTVLCRNSSPVDLFSLLGGNPDSGGIWSAGNGIFDPATGQSGNYEYTVSTGACPAVGSSVTVTVNELPKFTLGADQTVCSGNPIILSSDQPGSSYLWQDGSSNDTFETIFPGLYWLEITDSLGCTDRDTINISTGNHVRRDSFTKVCPGDFVSFQGLDYFSDTTICIVNPTFSGCDSTFCLNISFLSDFADSVKAEICNNEFYTFYGMEYTEPGIYEQLFITANGCDSIEALELNVFPIPVITLEGETEICFPETGTLSVTETYPLYFWSTGSKEKSISTPEGQYSVTVTDENGCKASAEKTIRSEQCEHIYIPNIFSPNNDMTNDNFYVDAKSYVEQISVKVFDRWGNQVFEGGGNDLWDGTYRGQDAISDVYIYIVEMLLPSGKKIIKKGDVSLIR